LIVVLRALAVVIVSRQRANSLRESVLAGIREIQRESLVLLHFCHLDGTRHPQLTLHDRNLRARLIYDQTKMDVTIQSKDVITNGDTELLVTLMVSIDINRTVPDADLTDSFAIGAQRKPGEFHGGISGHPNDTAVFKFNFGATRHPGLEANPLRNGHVQNGSLETMARIAIYLNVAFHVAEAHNTCKRIRKGEWRNQQHAQEQEDCMEGAENRVCHRNAPQRAYPIRRELQHLSCCPGAIREKRKS
jgi:hypothetical protein